MRPLRDGDSSGYHVVKQVASVEAYRTQTLSEHAGFCHGLRKT